MVTKPQLEVMEQEDKGQKAVFYLERILEQLDMDVRALAQKIFFAYRSEFETMLNPEHFRHLQERASVVDNWTPKKEKQFYERVKNAVSFNESKVVHDLAHEIILHHHHPAETCSTHWIFDEMLQLLAQNNNHYLEPDEICINTFLDAKIQFIVEQRRPRQPGKAPLVGNPGFHLTDVLNRSFRCFVKQVSGVKLNEELKLKITNLPGLTISTRNIIEPVVYLEPRVTPEDLIEVELLNLSHTGNSFTFRHHSYDGFLWFKRRGVNKEIFNKKTLQPKDHILAKVLYTSEEVKQSNRGTISRLGVIKAIPIKRVEEGESLAENPETGAAKALN